MTKAIFYTRFSPRRNSAECASCATQLQLCKRYAESKSYEIGADFRDEAISGACTDRPGLQDAVTELSRGDVLVVYKRDRLARDVYLSEVIERDVKKAGATIEAVSGDIEGHSDEVVMIRQIMASFAQLERKWIASRTRAAMQVHQGNGFRMGRYPPYGWRLDPDFVQVEDGGKRVREMMLVDERECGAIEKILKMRVGEGLGWYVIVREMNGDDEMRVLSRAGKWNVKAVRKVCERSGLNNEKEAK